MPQRALKSKEMLAVLVVASLLVLGATKKELKEREKALAEPYRQFLMEVALLITPEERETFLLLEEDYQRDKFIQQFWEIRDRYSDTVRNEFRDLWYRRLEYARANFDSLDGDRARILMLNGMPDGLVRINCAALWPGEVWYYARPANWGSEVALLFIQRWGAGDYRLWNPQDGFNAMLRFRDDPADALSGCPDEQESAIGLVFRLASQLGTLGYPSLLAALEEQPEKPSEEWVASFNTYSTDVPEGADTFEASLELDFPGRRQSRTLVQGIVAIPLTEAVPTELGGHSSYNFVLTGEVLTESRLFDRFRYKFSFPADSVAGETIPLVFERYLRPGEYRMFLKVEDLGAKSFLKVEQLLEVPRVEFARAEPPPDSETARLLAEANRFIATGDTNIKLVRPFGELHSGLMRFDTLTSGPDIAEVAFMFDDKEVLRKTRPPFSVELDLGPLPRRRVVAAVAYDTQKREIARDELTLNAGSHRFAARLVEPRPGANYVDSLRARAEIELPEGRLLDRVEYYLNETLVATLYQEPWVQPIVLPQNEFAAYVRVVAYQPDGNFTEDTVFINGPEFAEEVKVNFVELYVAALDRDKRPVDDLTEADFSVVEDGTEQTKLRFDKVSNLPIHAGVLFDISASMEENLELAQLAALRFFEKAIQPRDRATLITFNDHPNLVVQFTNELAQLSGGLAGLKAERGTSLYDSIIFSLYYFNGVRGQRAIVLLSDGHDENSKFEYSDALEFARRAGVAVYAIGLKLPKRELDARRKLRKLAEETGGRAFFIQEAPELAQIYDIIQQELRSRYYLAYQSSNAAFDDRFRTIEVKIDRGGVEAKTKSGYYP